MIVLHRNLTPIWNCFLRNVAGHDLLQLLKRHWLNSIARGVFLIKENLCFLLMCLLTQPTNATSLGLIFLPTIFRNFERVKSFSTGQTALFQEEP